jgi:hypothetical protein
MVRGESMRYDESGFPVSTFSCVVWSNLRSVHCTTLLGGKSATYDLEGFRKMNCLACWKVCLWQHGHKYTSIMTGAPLHFLIHGLATTVYRIGHRDHRTSNPMPYMKDFVHERKVNRRHGLIPYTVDKATRVVNRDSFNRISRCCDRVRICVETKVK